MFSTLRGTLHARVARRKARVSSIGASSPTRSTAASAGASLSPIGPALPASAALLIKVAEEKASCWLCSQASRRADADTPSARSTAHCSSDAPAFLQPLRQAFRSGWRDIVSSTAPRCSSCSAIAAPRPREAPVVSSTCAAHASNALLQAGFDEVVQIAVEHRLRVADLIVGAQILDARLVEHVRADLMAPADVGL